MYMFLINFTNGSGSTTAVILGDVAEKMLDMTTKDIFDTACDRYKLRPISYFVLVYFMYILIM